MGKLNKPGTSPKRKSILKEKTQGNEQATKKDLKEKAVSNQKSPSRRRHWGILREMLNTLEKTQMKAGQRRKEGGST